MAFRPVLPRAGRRTDPTRLWRPTRPHRRPSSWHRSWPQGLCKGVAIQRSTLASWNPCESRSKDALVGRVAEVSGRTASSVRNELAKPVPDQTLASVLGAVNGDRILAERIKPFANLVRNDAWGEAIIYRAQSFMVASGTDRRETGTHYTPRSHGADCQRCLGTHRLLGPVGRTTRRSGSSRLLPNSWTSRFATLQWALEPSSSKRAATWLSG